MKKNFFIFLAIFMITLSLTTNAQKPLLIINGEKISPEEFLSVYNKNNTNKQTTKEDIEEYLELFINFKLKVAEAMEMKLDTPKSFRTELSGYRQQLALPYLSKTEVLDKLVREVYERLQFDLRTSHILIKLPKYPSPADTLAAYKKVQDIYKRLQKGESFEKLAVELSDDETARTVKKGNQTIPGNKGDLGYFSAMDLIYEFENAAYNLTPGQISKPIRTEYGYHIIKLTEKRPALGRVQTAHILVGLPENPTQQEKDSVLARANMLYDKIQKGESYETVAQQFSDDKGSAMRGGILPWFGVFKMLPDFITPLYDLKKGDITKPILTSYGYHIIKLVDRKPVGTFDEMKSDLKSKVMRDARYTFATKALTDKLKVEENYKEYPAALNEITTFVNDSIYKGKWKADVMGIRNALLFSIGNKEFFQKDFAVYLEQNQSIAKEDNIASYIKTLFDKFTQEKIIQYESENLEKKYPNFASLMKEYHDGILLFELTDKKVWNKAVKDTTGLEAYYEKIKMNYMWPERIKGTIFTVADKKTAAKVRKDAITMLSKHTLTPEQIAAKYNTEKGSIVNSESSLYIKAEHPYFMLVKKTGVSKPELKDGKYVIYVTEEIKQPEPKQLKEIRGLVTNEYQNYLEKEWIAQLRAKYHWEVNKDILKTLY